MNIVYNCLSGEFKVVLTENCMCHCSITKMSKSKSPYTKNYTKKEINKILNIKINSKNEVVYFMNLKKRGPIWLVQQDIAKQTKGSIFFNNLRSQCERIPDDLTSHKQIMDRATLMSESELSVSFEVRINNDKSTLLIFPMNYKWKSFQGHLVKTIAQDIVNTYKKMHYLPITPQNVLHDIDQVCFILFFVHCIYIYLWLRNCVK